MFKQTKNLQDTCLFVFSSCREIEEINKRAATQSARPRASRAPRRPLSAQLHPTYYSDLADDTDPARDPTPTGGASSDPSRDSSVPRPSSARARRVYLIRRPRSAPVYGRITPVSCRSDVDADVDVGVGVAVREATPVSRETTLASPGGGVQEERTGKEERASGDSASSRREFSRVQPLAPTTGDSPEFEGERTVGSEKGRSDRGTERERTAGSGKGRSDRGTEGERTVGSEKGRSDRGTERERTLRSADRGAERRPASPVRIVDNDSERKLHSEGSVRIRPLYAEGVNQKPQHKAGDEPGDVDFGGACPTTDPPQTPTDKNDRDTVRHTRFQRPSSQTLADPAQPDRSAGSYHHREECARVDALLSGREAAAHSDVNAERARTEAEAAPFAGSCNGGDAVVSSGSLVVEHRPGSVASERCRGVPELSRPSGLVAGDSNVPRAVDVDSHSALQGTAHQASGLSEDGCVGGHHGNASGVSCEQRTRAGSDTGAGPRLRSTVAAAAAHSVPGSAAGPSGASKQGASKPLSDSSWSSLPSLADPSPRNSSKPSAVRGSQSSAESASLSEGRPRAPSSLRSSRLTFGSVDSLLVGIDAETRPSPRKSKSKKSWLKSWFTPKKGKYNPGAEPIPSIETWTGFPASEAICVPKADEEPTSASANDSDSRVRGSVVEQSSANANDSDSRVRGSVVEQSSANANDSDARIRGSVVEQSSANANDSDSNVRDSFVDSTSSDTDDPGVLKETPENQPIADPVPTTADTMDGTTTKRSHSSEASRHVQQETTLTQAVSSSSSDGDGVRSTTVKTLASSKLSQQTVLQQRSVEIEDSRSPSAADVANDRALPFRSGQALKGSSAGAYENTNVTFSSNVTRHEVITIKGSSLTSYDRSVMLNDSGFPDDLSSTFKAKPVMVRERRVSSSSLLEENEASTTTTTTRRGSDSSSSLSFVELDPRGMVKLSQKHGSTEDLELFSKASRIIHAQRSEDELQGNCDDDDDGVEGEPELVVIREYVFATRKQGGGAARVETSSEFKTVTSSSLHASLQSSLEAEDGGGGKASGAAAPAVKEEDSGLDSPPSLQDSQRPPVKPKRGARASRDMDVCETGSPKAESREDYTDSGSGQSSSEQDHSIAVDAHTKPAHVVTVRRGESEDKTDAQQQQQQQHFQPESFVNKVFASQQPERLKTSPGATEASFDKGRGELPQADDANADLGAASSAGPAVTFAAKKHEDLSQPADKGALSEVFSTEAQTHTEAEKKERELPAPEAQAADSEGSSAGLAKALPDTTGKESSEPDDTKRSFQAPVSAAAPSYAEKKQGAVTVPVAARMHASPKTKERATFPPDDTAEISASAAAPTHSALEKQLKKAVSQPGDRTEVPVSADPPEDVGQPDGKGADSHRFCSINPIYAVPDKKHKQPVAESRREASENSGLYKPAQLDPLRKHVTSGQRNEPEQPVTSVEESAPKNKEQNNSKAERANEGEMKASSAPAVMAATQQQKHQAEKEGTATKEEEEEEKQNHTLRKKSADGTNDNDDDKSTEDNPKLPERLSRYRDSLTEEEYNKPWSSDFSRIEDDIRSRITAAFPSAQEEDEREEDAASKDRPAPAASAGGSSTASPLLSAARKSPSTTSKDSSSPDSGLAENVEKARRESERAPASGDSAEEVTPAAESPPRAAAKSAAADPAAMYTDLQYVDDSQGADKGALEESVILPASAAPSFSTAPAAAVAAKSFDRSERPPPPLPPASSSPSSTVGQTPREVAKPALLEKPRKASAEEKAGSHHHHHSKLKERFMKVFSSSSEDKKAAKAEQKKVAASASAPKEDGKGGATHAGEEDKASKAEHKKAGEDKKPVAPAEQKKASTQAKEEPKEAQPSPATEEEKASPEADKLPPKTKDEGTKGTPPSAEEEKNVSGAEQGGLLQVQGLGHEVKLPLSPKEARKLIKAEKKNASKAQQEQPKEAASADDPKVTSPKAPSKALNWIKKKLATKGKKAPKTKKYSFNATEDAEDEAPDASAKSPGASDANSASDDSHDSGSSDSDSNDDEEEEEKKKTKRKMPFWGGRKDKKKAAEHGSDSDSSAEESRSKLFSWSLGRKKEADSSDHEDSIPASYKKTSEWAPSGDAGGVSGTFKKIPDTAPLSQWHGESEPSSSKAAGDQPSKPNEGTAEAQPPDSPAHCKVKSAPVSESASAAKPETLKSKSSPNHAGEPSHPETGAKEVSDADKVGAEGGTEEASGQGPGKIGLEPPSQAKPNLAAPPKLFWVDDNGDTDSRKRNIGEYARLRKDATVGPAPALTSKVPQDSGYELAKPLFLKERVDAAAGVPPGKEKDLPASPHAGLPGGKPHSVAEPGAATLKSQGGEMPEGLLVEEAIVPAKAARPVLQQAFNLLEKSPGGGPGANIVNGPSGGGAVKAAAAKAQPKPGASEKEKSPPSPVATPRRNKPSLQSSPKPKLAKEEEAKVDPVVEEEIVPRTADEEFRTFNLTRSPAFKLKLHKRGAGEPSGALENAGKSDATSDTDPKDPATQRADDGGADAKPRVDVELSDTASPATKVDESPRSDGSAGHTYIDGSDFLNTAKASWSRQDSEPSGAEPKPDSNREHLDQGETTTSASNTPGRMEPETGARDAGKTDAALRAANSGNAAPQDAVEVGAENPHPAKKPAIAIQKPAKPATAAKPAMPAKPATAAKPAVSVQKPARPTEGDSGSSQLSAGLHNDDAKFAEGLGDAADSSTGLSNKGVPESNAGDASSRKPIELLTTPESREAAEDSIKPEAVAKVESKPDAAPQSSSEGAIDWLDTQMGPPRPVITAPKPNVRPKPLAKPKGFKPKGDNKDPKEAESKSSSSPKEPDMKAATTAPSESSSSQSSLQAKPSLAVASQEDGTGGTSKPAPVEQKTTPRDEAAHIGSGVGLRFPKAKSPEPRPRTSLNVSPNSTSDPPQTSDNSQTSTGGDSATSSPSTATRDPGGNGKGAHDDETIKTSSPPLSSTFSEGSRGDDTFTDRSTSTWGEAAAVSMPSPNVGDFTLSLEPAGKAAEERSCVQDVAAGDADSAAEDRKREPSAQPEGDSSLTNVTPLSEGPKSLRSTPLSKSTPVTESTPLSSDVFASTSSSVEEITVTSISTIHKSTVTKSHTSASSTSTTFEQSDSEIYEPIFFLDINDPNSGKKPTEAPPVRPEKVRKRHADPPPEMVQPEFDDDLDNMYDVPPSRRKFSFPRENTLPVVSVVDKRASRTSLKPTTSFEPEDSIAPYATYHRPQYLKQEAEDYGDDENPYMNDDDDLLQDLTRSGASPSAEEALVAVETVEAVHASMSELAPRPPGTDQTGGKENASRSSDPETKEAAGVGGTRAQGPKKAAERRSVTEPSDSESFDSSSEGEADSAPDKEAAGCPGQKREKGEKGADRNSAGTTAGGVRKGDRAPDADGDQFLQSDEYVNSVEEINKLYAALEKEEEEMEKRASVGKTLSPESDKKSQTSEIREEPQTSESHKEPQTSESHKDPHTSESHKEPQTSESREEPQTPESHKEPQTPECHKEPQTSESHKEPQPSESHKEPQTSESHKEPQTSESHKEPQTSETHMEPQSSSRPARMPLGRLLSFEEQRAELKPLKRRPEDEPTLAVPQVPEETSKPVNKVKSKEAKAAKKRESKTTTTTITTSFTETRTSSVEATVVKVHGAKAESSQPPGKAAAEERQKAGGKPAEKPAIRAKPRRPSEEGAQSAEKKEAPAAKGTVLPQITGFSKLVDKVLHKGEEQQVKVKPEGGGQGGAGGDAEPGKDADDGGLSGCLSGCRPVSLFA